MLYSNSQDAINALAYYIDSLYSATVYVGITSDLPQRIGAHKQEYGQQIGEHFHHVACTSDTVARAVESHFLTNGRAGKRIIGGPGGGDDGATIAYVFPV